MKTEVTKTFRGAFASPFVRAYPPVLADVGISQSAFLSFVDGVNEAFIGSPAFGATGVLGIVMQQFYGLPPVQFAGIGLSVASGFGSAAVSYGRTRAYFKAVNPHLFHPVGLHATVSKTKKMMAAIGVPEDHLKLPPLGRGGAACTDPADWEQIVKEDEPVMRRLRALSDYISPLDFDVPPSVAPDSLLKKMGDAKAKKALRKQHKKLMARRPKAYRTGYDPVWGQRSKKAQRKILKVERSIEKEEHKLEEKLAKSHDDKRKAKATRKSHKKLARLRRKIKRLEETDGSDSDSGSSSSSSSSEDEKLVKAERKEEKIAQKIYWIVISQWDGEEDGDGDTADDLDDDVEHEHEVTKH